MVAPLVLDERYRVVRQIRQTEDTALFLVRDLAHDALVALKVFLAPDENALKSYQKHLQVIQTLSHPHIAKTLDSGTTEASSQFLFGGGRGKHLYLATEYIVGPNFQTAFPPESLLNAAAYRNFITTARQVCEALDYVHRRSLVHLDIKPENILLVPESGGRGYSARLIDFDLLQTVSTPIGAKVRGTLPLVSPEVLRDSLISEKADLYSLGATLYLVASGRHPFSASTDRGLIKRILWHQPAPLEKLAPQLPHA
ncbi:MAG: serine/threonine protein kinase, partial [Planctomycetes bacterium]|nr:serine/threonine protein kinase [Planctomycetota bacterium]